jgi:hypothetical protein
MRYTRRVAIAALCFLGLAAAAAAGWWYRPLHQVEQSVRAQLKDPDSAKFDRVQFFRRTGAGCGWVNARNSMGGYVGLTHFLVSSKGEVAFEPTDSTEIGTTEQQLAAVQKRLEYLRLVEAACPEHPRVAKP